MTNPGGVLVFDLQSRPCKNVVLRRGLLAERAEVVREKVIPYQWDALNNRVAGAEPSYAIDNLRVAAGEKSGEFQGMVFQDSDVAKWLEAVAYTLATHPEEHWAARADEVIDIVSRAQQPDGYLNSYYTIVKPDQRWTNLRENHELYCAGHFIEAAVAYYEATGQDKLLKVVCKLVEHIDSVFGPAPEKKKGYPGHEEIELALIKLYRITGNPRHLNLAKYFVEERGKAPHYFDLEAKQRGEHSNSEESMWSHAYSQSHLPVREQKTAEGHAVRAMYLYCALADLVLETGDLELAQVCADLWNNTVQRRMYITGGIGSQEYGERFTIDYDLPNDTAYTETCAAIGLVFWAHRMLQISADRKYADVLERALYNGVLSGISFSGEKFFYVNPLEVRTDVCAVRYDHRHVKSTRQEWFGCACCPPNIARLLASIGTYVYTQAESTVYVHLFTDSEVSTTIAKTQVKVCQTTNYPWDETVNIKVSTERDIQFSLGLRIPGWCKNPSVTVNGNAVDLSKLSQGYLFLTRTWSAEDNIELTLPMPVERVRASSKVAENIGKVVLQRGPVVYCLEEVDNGPNLPAICLPEEANLGVELDNVLQLPVIIGEALRLEDSTAELYTTAEFQIKATKVKAIPYFAWDNRKPGELLVWLREGGPKIL